MRHPSKSRKQLKFNGYFSSDGKNYVDEESVNLSTYTVQKLQIIDEGLCLYSDINNLMTEEFLDLLEYIEIKNTVSRIQQEEINKD